MTPALFHASDRVRATALPGSEPRLVVSFTGVGAPGPHGQAEEFVGASHMGERNHVLFVADCQRSWYNAPGVYEEILDLVQSYKRTHAIKDVVTLGESMGGYGAILFAGALGARSCLSLSAQYSADPRVVPEEDRWTSYRSKIAHFTRPPLEKTLSEECAYFVVHPRGERERPHWTRFPRARQFNHYLTDPVDEPLSHKMQGAGKLEAITHCAILARPVVFRRYLSEAFGSLRRVGKD